MELVDSMSLIPLPSFLENAKICLLAESLTNVLSMSVPFRRDQAEFLSSSEFH